MGTRGALDECGRIQVPLRVAFPASAATQRAATAEMHDAGVRDTGAVHQRRPALLGVFPPALWGMAGQGSQANRHHRLWEANSHCPLILILTLLILVHPSIHPCITMFIPRRITSAFVALLVVASAGVIAQSSSGSSSSSSAATSSSTNTSASSASSSSSSSTSAQSQTPTASSNYSLPSPSATASWPAGLVLQSSVPYQLPTMDWDELATELPEFSYHLANESLSTRQSICNRQTSFCATAGCADSTATVKENFCNVETLAARCSCSKGDSNLDQANWPVQLADCQNRANACSSACWSPATSVEKRNSCRDTCDKTFRQSCGTPGMVSANYAVAKESQTPSYTLIQGGNASGALTFFKPALSLVISAVGLTTFATVFLL